MNLDESAIVEYEREREKWNLDTDPNLAEPSSKLGCGGLLIRVVIGLVIFRAILEVFSFFL